MTRTTLSANVTYLTFMGSFTQEQQNTHSSQMHMKHSLRKSRSLAIKETLANLK